MTDMQSMDLKDVRTRVFGGYDKQDVRRYISSILKGNDDELSAAKKQTAHLCDSNKRLTAKLDDMAIERERITERLLALANMQAGQLTFLFSWLVGNAGLEESLRCFKEKIETLESSIYDRLVVELTQNIEDIRHDVRSYAEESAEEAKLAAQEIDRHKQHVQLMLKQMLIQLKKMQIDMASEPHKPERDDNGQPSMRIL